MALLERAEQLRTVGSYLAEAAAGHGRLVFVAGEAGVGKSSFVDAVVVEAGESARVAIGLCDGSATPPPLGPLIEMLPLLPIDVWPPESARQDVFARLVTALRAPVRPEPYLLVVEDAHWADEATLDLIRYLGRRIHDGRALVMVTYRPEDTAADHPLRIVVGDAATMTGARRLDLAPLSLSAVRVLVAKHAAVDPASAPADADHLHRVTGGNAFFLTEALSAGSAQVPPTVRDAVLSRTARLSAPARHVMDVVALAGVRAEVDVLETVLADRLSAMDEPLERGLLKMAGDDVVFRHELARMAVVDQVPTFRRISIHRQILAALRQRGDAGMMVDPARMAHHAEAAGDAEAVLAFAPEAAARASALGAHREAADQYRRVLKYADRLADPRRADLMWAMAYECYLTQRIEDAIAFTQQALEIWDAAGDAVRVGDSYRCLSRLNWFAGRNDIAERQATLAVDTLSDSASSELAMAYSNLAQLRMLSSDLSGTRKWGARALEVLDDLPKDTKHTEVAVHALNNLGTAEITAGDWDAGVRMLASSLEQARAGDLHEHAARAYCNLVSTAVVQRRHADATTYLGAGLDYCLDRDLDAWTLYLQGWQARLLLDRGEFGAAREAAVKVLRRAGLSSVGQIEPLVVRALVEARSGGDDWREPLDLAARLADRIGESQRLGPVVAAECETGWLDGDVDAARRHAANLWPRMRESDCPWNRGSVATWLGEVPAADITGLAPPYALEASGRWVDAAEIWDELCCPYEAALARARSGEQSALTQAVSEFDLLEADAAAARARGLLRARGWAAPRRPREDARRHPAGLSDREAEVLSLISEGLPDAGIAERLVLSRRTVEHHVSSILAKLGVRSRREAARAMSMGSTAGKDG